MKLTCTEFSKWDDEIFQSFIDLKQQIQGEIPTYFPETLNDYKKILHPDSPFSEDYEWQGFLIFSGHVLVGKAILAWRKGIVIGNLGFIDWIDDKAVASLLGSQVEGFARAKGLTQIKSPVDLNFFIKYRIKCPGGGAPYYGEPIYPDYYHELFKSAGFTTIGTWDTYKIERYRTFGNFVKKRKQIKGRRHQHYDQVSVRFIRLNDWENELKIVHELFLASFKDMTEFEPITFAQFKLIYDDFKYLINPLLSYIVELQGVPVGFSINYPDPLEILNKSKHKKLSHVEKILLLAKLKLNFKTLLMPYMGKTTGPNGEEVKGVFLKVTKMLTYGILAAEKALVCYQSPDSPSKRPLDPELVKEYARYVLYGKKLE